MVRFLRAEMNVMCVHQSLKIAKQLPCTSGNMRGARANEKLRLLRTQTTFIRDYHCMSHTGEANGKEAQENERETKKKCSSHFSFGSHFRCSFLYSRQSTFDDVAGTFRFRFSTIAPFHPHQTYHHRHFSLELVYPTVRHFFSVLLLCKSWRLRNFLRRSTERYISFSHCCHKTCVFVRSLCSSLVFAILLVAQLTLGHESSLQ